MGSSLRQVLPTAPVLILSTPAIRMIIVGKESSVFAVHLRGPSLGVSQPSALRVVSVNSEVVASRAYIVGVISLRGSLALLRMIGVVLRKTVMTLPAAFL